MDWESVREDFPIFKRKINGEEIHYLDNAATSQKPERVITAIKRFYENHNANVHRSIHALGEEATRAYEESRKEISEFVGCKKEEVVFTKNATEALNLSAQAISQEIREGSKICCLISEHHSNFIPWQQLAKRRGAKFVPIKLDRNFEPEDIEVHLEGASVFALAHISNVIGKINDVKKMCKMAKKEGAITVVDGAQSAPHISVDVGEIGCDMFAFTGHKMLGPMGIGVAVIRKCVWDKTIPFMYGGEMISGVSVDKSEWAEMPYKMEAGTPNVCGAFALAEATRYIKKIGMHRCRNREKEITKMAVESVEEAGANILGEFSEEERGALVSFWFDSVHPHDAAAILAERNVMVRSGMHCAEPLHKEIGVNGTIRASFHIYNNEEDIHAFSEGLRDIKEVC